MKYLLIICLLFINFSAIAQQEVKIEDAAKHVGDSVKICSIVYGGKYLEASEGSPTFLNLGAAYPNALLTIVIRENVRNQFKGSPEKLFNKELVCVTGKVELYKGKPQIVLSKSDLIYINQ